MDNPLISVVIPIYNREQYIVEAIESVLAQDYAPLELIVVDDGSTDASTAVIRPFLPRLRYFHQQNQGVAVARNAGVARTSGPFLAFLDSDDIWLRDKLTRQMAVFAAHPETEGVFGHAEQFISPELDSDYGRRIRSQTGIIAAPLTAALLIRRTAFDRVGPFDVRFNLAAEMDWQARLVEQNVRTVMLPDVVYRRRLHQTNLNLECADQQSERLHVLKAMLDRRRRQAAKPVDP